MPSSPKIGLALGGGGARGLAHIPMLEVFDELGLRPAVIAGSSMGALVGAAYASGMSGKDLRKHCETLLVNRVSFARHVFGARRTRPFELLSLRGLASMHLSGERLADVALPDWLPQVIEDTDIPLKIIATDYERMEERVLTSGPLLKAVGASIAIPGVISAPVLDGRIHVDGGVVNPVPFDHVRDGMDLVVAIDVNGKPKAVSNGRISNLDVAIGSLLIMFNRIAELKRALSPPDIYIQPALENVAVGDFFRARDIFERCHSAQDTLRQALTTATRKLSLPAKG